MCVARAVVAAVIALALAPAAHAAVFGPPHDHSSPEVGPAQHGWAEIADDGTVTAAWSQEISVVPSFNGGGGDRNVWLRRFNVDQDPATGSTYVIDDGAGADVNMDDFAINGAGDAIVLWRSAASGVLEFVRFGPGVPFPPPVVGQATSEPVFGPLPQVAMNDEGQATVAFWANPNVAARRIAPDGTPLDPTYQLAHTPGNSPVFDLLVAVDPAGASTIAWMDTTADHQHFTLRAQRIAADGTLDPDARVVASDVDAVPPAIDVDASGTVTIVWTDAGAVRSRQIKSDGSLTDVQTLSQASGGEAHPTVSVNAAGVGIAAWTRGGLFGAHEVQARRIEPDGTPGSAVLDVGSTHPSDRWVTVPATPRSSGPVRPRPISGSRKLEESPRTARSIHQPRTSRLLSRLCSGNSSPSILWATPSPRGLPASSKAPRRR
jgi:hypothetical protein